MESKSMQRKRKCEKKIEMEYEKNAFKINLDYAQKYDSYFNELEKQKYDKGYNEEIEKLIDEYDGACDEVFDIKYSELLNRIYQYKTEFDEKIYQLENDRDKKIEIEWNKRTVSIDILFDKGDKNTEDVCIDEETKEDLFFCGCHIIKKT